MPPRKPRGESALRRATKAAAMGAGVTGSYLGYLAQSLFLAPDARKAKLETTHRKTARRLADGMIDLRGTLMKVGQGLSLHGNVLPAETVAELSRLQARAPGMHPSLVRAQFRASTKRDPDDVFASFDPTPFAAASIGQVHRARLRGGEEVVVKIQYPGIRDAIEADLKWLRTAMLPARVSKHVPPRILDEVQEQLRAETDYAREAENIKVFSKGLAPLGFMEVPRVYPAQSTDRVLTMSLVPGEHLEEFLAGRPSQRLRDLIGSRLFEAFYFQICRLGALHGDPHWGNYLFRKDGTIGLIDFGCVKYFPSQFVTTFRKLFLYGGRYDSGEFRRLMEEHYASSGTRVSPTMYRALESVSRRFYRRAYPPEPEADARAIDFSDASLLRDYMEEASQVMRARGMQPEYVLLGRAELGLYQTLHRLGARVRTSGLVRQFLQPTEPAK